MLNAYISKEDIIKLLNETEDIGGFVDRSSFQKNIGRLKSIKKPVLKKKVRIKDREKLILAIDLYLTKVKDKIIKPQIIDFFEDVMKSGAPLESKIISIENNRNQEISIFSIAIREKEVIAILNISKPTFSKYVEIGIIKKHKGKTEQFNFETDYYNLEEIKKNLER